MIQMRGRSALDEGDYLSAIGHLTALVDHAPITPWVTNCAAWPIG